ncbi:MAG: hypothetical protein ACYC7A_10785 [Thermoanaerobaculia bacterium]
MVPLEQFASNPENRHVPPADVLIRRLDSELRPKLGAIWDSLFASLTPDAAALRIAFEGRIRYVVRWLDRIAHLARGPQTAPSEDLRIYLNRAFDTATAALQSFDANRLRRRTPFHLFERSRGELIYAAFVVVECTVAELAEQISVLDPSLPEKLINAGTMKEPPQGEALLKRPAESLVREY